MTHNLAFES